MKYFIVIFLFVFSFLAFLTSGCSTSESPQMPLQLGLMPTYANTWQPPFEGAERQLECECCPPTDWTTIAMPQIIER